MISLGIADIPSVRIFGYFGNYFGAALCLRKAKAAQDIMASRRSRV